MKKYLRMLRTVFTVWSLLTLVVGQAGLASLPVAQSFGQKAQAQEIIAETDQIIDQPVVTDSQLQPEAATPPEQVIICHATSSPSNPYERLQMSSSAIEAHFDNSGTPKAGHESDILYYDLDAQCPGPVVTTVGGMKWEDVNGNSERDEDEQGVADVRIDITQQVLEDSALNTQLYASTTYTDDNGNYQFVDVPMYGSFRICETVPAGWHQTYPIDENGNCHYYNTYASIAISSYDFGNQRDPQEPVCGNQIKDEGEQCDDGNTINGDGCSSSCQLETPQCTDQQSGWWSEYFNLPSNHPDVGTGDIPYFPYDDNAHGDPLGDWAPWTADWYDAQYYRFSRVDANLNFGDDFFPMDMIHEEVDPALNNHDFFFAVHSRATVIASTTDDYSYTLRSDDDSWVYIDGVRFDDKDGIHPPATSGITEMPLTAGEHIIDVFYAERHPLGATLVLTLDNRLTVMPAPEDCQQCSNPLDYNHDQAITLSDAVLFTTYYENNDIRADINGNDGVDYGDYLCSYTPIATALYQCPLVCAAVCGDHIVQQNLQEQCDDGNVTNGDGCNARCQTETNECEVPNPLDYNGDYELNASDAVTFTQYYSTDDLKADVNNNDIVDYGDYLCAQPYYSGQLAYTCSLSCAEYTPVCGDTHKDANEQCDDGNTANGDGCSSSCQIERICEGDDCGGGGGSYCGDGHLDEGEQCDDGNSNDDDSCSNECTLNDVPPVTPPTRTGGGGGGGGLSPQTNLTIVKTASTAFATPGSQVTYTISVKNTGNTIATNVNLNDTLPAGFTFVDGGGTTKTWHWDTIAVGQTVSVSYGVNISSTATIGVYPNVAVVTSPTGPVSAQAFVNVEVRQPQVLGVETQAPAAPAPEKVRVLGFETLPNTSGDWNYLGMIAAFFVLSLGIIYGRKAFKA